MKQGFAMALYPFGNRLRVPNFRRFERAPSANDEGQEMSVAVI